MREGSPALGGFRQSSLGFNSGDARFSYFLSATRKDVVDGNEVSLLPLHILAIGAWSSQRNTRT